MKREKKTNDNKVKASSTNLINKSIANNIDFLKIPSNNEKINFSHKNILRCKKDIKNIVKHVCYCCQRLHFKYHIFVASKQNIERTMEHVFICKTCKNILTLENLLNYFYEIIS